MKLNTNYVEAECFDFHRKPCGCPPPRPKPCGCDNIWTNPWFNPQSCFPHPQPPCFPQFPPQQPCFPGFPCQPDFCQQPCMPSCGCINFAIPLSFLYLYAGYMIGNNKKDC